MARRPARQQGRKSLAGKAPPEWKTASWRRTTASRAVPACRRLSGSAASRDTAPPPSVPPGGRSPPSPWRKNGGTARESARLRPARPASGRSAAASLPDGFGRRLPSEPTKNSGLMTPVAAAKGRSARSAARPVPTALPAVGPMRANPAASRSPPSSSASPVRSAGRTGRLDHHGKQRGHDAVHKYPRRAVDRVSTVSESSSISAASPKIHAIQSLPSVSFPAYAARFPSFPGAMGKFVSKSSQFMQQNVTLLRHTICEVIAWQRF